MMSKEMSPSHAGRKIEDGWSRLASRCESAARLIRHNLRGVV